MKKGISLLLVIICIFSLSACNCVYKPTSNGETNNTEKENNVIKIGVFEPQSGKYALGGRQEALGVSFSHKSNSTVTIGDKKYKIKLVTADTKSDYNTSLEMAQMLVDEGVCAVIGAYGSEDAGDAYELFKNNSIPVVSPSYSSVYGFDEKSTVFSLSPNVYEEVKTLAQYMKNTLKISKVTIICDATNSRSTASSLIFKELYEKMQGETVVESFESAEAFPSLLQNVNKEKAGAVYVPISTAYAKAFIDSCLSEKLSVPVFTVREWEGNEVSSYLLQKNVNIYVPSVCEIDEESKLYCDMKKWIEKDGDLCQLNSSENISYLNVLSFDAYSLVVIAIKKAGSFEPKAIGDALSAISFTSNSGQLSFDKNGNRENVNIVIKKLK